MIANWTTTKTVRNRCNKLYVIRLPFKNEQKPFSELLQIKKKDLKKCDKIQKKHLYLFKKVLPET